jgi:hypothetical protein
MLNHTRDRLNALLRPRPLLDVQDIIHIAEVCAYDSQSIGEEWLGWSRWCGMFDREEWEVIGYAKEVLRYYEVGEGSVSG